MVNLIKQVPFKSLFLFFSFTFYFLGVVNLLKVVHSHGLGGRVFRVTGAARKN